MFKQITIIAFLVIGLGAAAFLYKYIPYYLHHNNIKFYFNTPKQEKQMMSLSLNYLTDLSEIPFIGVLFLEEKVIQLTRLSKYQAAIKESKRALENSINQDSFMIWYHKALSECMLKKIEDCQLSLYKANLYSNKYTDAYVQSIYDLLIELKKMSQNNNNNTKVDGQNNHIFMSEREEMHNNLEDL